MVITVFTYGLKLGALFKKLVGKQTSLMKETMERVHWYMKQEEEASEKIKTNHGERGSQAPYVIGNTLEKAKNQNTRQARFHRLPQTNCNALPRRNSPRMNSS